MRFTILSNAPWSNSGYGNQLKILAPRLLKKGHQISIVAYYGHQGAPIDWEGCHLYGLAQDPYGMDVVAAHATDFGSEFILTNMDIWVIKPEMFLDKKWVAWMPVDSEPIPPLVEENARKAFHRIIWTKFAANEMDGAGLDYDYVPYGVDTKIFTPLDKAEAKKTAQFPPDKFIVGMVGMNKGFPCRKAFFENMLAFKYFNDEHPDSQLYLHTADGSKQNGMVVDLLYYCKRIGLKVGENVRFADPYVLQNGYSEEAMNVLYNSFDVLLEASMGEGFGLPIVEAQAAGTPVIVGGWTAMPELMFAGWQIDKATEAMPQYTLQNSYQYQPISPAIVDRLMKAYGVWQSTAARKEYSERARKGALKYDIDKIVDKYWVPTLANIEKKLQEAPEPSLAKNLEMLR